jgi:hypothetical protein
MAVAVFLTMRDAQLAVKLMKWAVTDAGEKVETVYPDPEYPKVRGDPDGDGFVIEVRPHHFATVD